MSLLHSAGSRNRQSNAFVTSSVLGACDQMFFEERIDDLGEAFLGMGELTSTTRRTTWTILTMMTGVRRSRRSAREARRGHRLRRIQAMHAAACLRPEDPLPAYFRSSTSLIGSSSHATGDPAGSRKVLFRGNLASSLEQSLVTTGPLHPEHHLPA